MFFNEFSDSKWIELPLIKFFFASEVWVFELDYLAWIDNQLGPVSPASLAKILCYDGDDGSEDCGELLAEVLSTRSDAFGCP